ncbi:hypothetical protein GCM10022263_27180 [Nocardioides daeguensis]|uniref:Uncharacterized protein n=1 Tax=Nocardioides daeguensis TaxID=908359 RepID=A0ABP6VNM4_9ACTN
MRFPAPARWSPSDTRTPPGGTMTAHPHDLEDTEEHEWAGLVLVLTMLALAGLLVMLFT